MTDHKIEAHKVTKPIQLLAAWLVGLVLVDAMFLAAALQLEQGWERGCLIAFAIINVPLFLAAIFVLQTKFRAELQEDTYYSDYLSKKTSTLVRVDTAPEGETKLEIIERQVSLLMRQKLADDSATRWAGWRVALNERHPQFNEVRVAMREVGIPLAEVFGAKDVAGFDSPSKWIASINEAMPTDLKIALLRLIAQFDFVGFQFWTPVTEAGETEDAYLGSYGDMYHLVITDELRTQLNGDFEEGDLSLYVRNQQSATARAARHAPTL